jgi:hypothetical protein
MVTSLELIGYSLIFKMSAGGSVTNIARVVSRNVGGGARLLLFSIVSCSFVFAQSSSAQALLGEEPALGSPESRITQAEIESGGLSLFDVRLSGLKMFATQFRKSDGYGDGPMNPANTTDPGGRPTLQGNGTFLRVNGLDAQACLDCHTVVSNDAMPFVSGVGGAGNLNNSAMFMTRSIDVEDAVGNGLAAFDGRLINPPALFGTGGVQLVAQEMTVTLQRLKAQAIRSPGKTIELVAKGVGFGAIRADSNGAIDTQDVVGVDDDLIVRPFGRKGEFTSVRQFDLGAMMFHLGMQPVEVVGEGIDDDGDTVANEVAVGEISALEIFITTQESPRQLRMGSVERAGLRNFRQLGCAGCHKPAIRTERPTLRYSFPELPDDPSQNVFFAADLTAEPPAFKRSKRGGIVVPMFSDLKRHDMGGGLAEEFHGASDQQNREFITAKLWGVADTAPYLHDGRAMTLNEAVLMHGGEAAVARDGYEASSDTEKNQLLAFLRTLRNPVSPNADVLN